MLKFANPSILSQNSEFVVKSVADNPKVASSPKRSPNQSQANSLTNAQTECHLPYFAEVSLSLHTAYRL